MICLTHNALLLCNDGLFGMEYSMYIGRFFDYKISSIDGLGISACGIDKCKQKDSFLAELEFLFQAEFRNMNWISGGICTRESYDTNTCTRTLSQYNYTPARDILISSDGSKRTYDHIDAKFEFVKVESTEYQPCNLESLFTAMFTHAYTSWQDALISSLFIMPAHILYSVAAIGYSLLFSLSVLFVAALSPIWMCFPDARAAILPNAKKELILFSALLFKDILCGTVGTVLLAVSLIVKLGLTLLSCGQAGEKAALIQQEEDLTARTVHGL